MDDWVLTGRALGMVRERCRKETELCAFVQRVNTLTGEEITTESGLTIDDS